MVPRLLQLTLAARDGVSRPGPARALIPGAKLSAGKRRRQRSMAEGGGEVFLVTARSHAPACRRKTAGPWAQQEASTAPSTERRGGGRGLVRGFFALAPEKVLHYEPHRVARKVIKWLYGATAARLTPDQKVGNSNLSALISATARRDIFSERRGRCRAVTMRLGAARQRGPLHPSPRSKWWLSLSSLSLRTASSEA